MADKDAVDTAWRVHAAVVDWTGKVDTKASYTLTLETAVMVGVVTLSSNGRVLTTLEGWRQVSFVAGAALLVGAILCAAFVVLPRLRSRKKLQAEAATNFIYFGHLKFSHPSAIARQLNNAEALLPALANQLHQMSRIAWRKHRFVQISMLLAIVGVIAISAAALFPGRG